MTPAPGQRRRVLALLFVTVVINYLDRSNLSVAATAVASDLHADALRMGWIFSAFGWTYVLFQIPGGWLADRLSPPKMYAVTCALWSLVTLLQGFAAVVAALIALRLLLGCFEAPSYPLCNRIIAQWYPPPRRAAAIATYTSGQFVGLAFLTPLLALAERYWGWRAVFFATGGVGLAWAGIWALACPRAPEPPGGLLRTPSAERAPWSALCTRPLCGIYLGQFAVNSTLWFFLTWFPTYLVQYRHFDFLRAGFAGSLPFLGAFAGVLVSGHLSDACVRRGVSPSLARKAPVIAGLLLSATMVGANFTNNHALILGLLTLAFFGNGMASITWVFVSWFAPPQAVGLSGGIFNACGNLASIVIPLAIGAIVQNFGFAPALAAIAGITVLGAASYVFIVPNRVPDASIASS